MTKTPRWIASAIKQSEADAPQMPWVRGARRAAWIATRDQEDALLLARA